MRRNAQTLLVNAVSVYPCNVSPSYRLTITLSYGVLTVSPLISTSVTVPRTVIYDCPRSTVPLSQPTNIAHSTRAAIDNFMTRQRCALDRDSMMADQIADATIKKFPSQF